MLQIEVPLTKENWDDEKEEFIEPECQTLQLEHSLVSLSKWESKWRKPFTSSNKTDEEILDYIKCMTITENVDPDVYDHLSEENVKAVKDYIDNPMTATTFRKDDKSQGSSEIVTSELIYYWMIASNIPFECQNWHLNRLLTLIRVCSIKSSPPKKLSKREIMSRNAALNAARKQQMNTKG